MTNLERKPADLTSYIERSKTGRCFICEIVAGNPDYRHHIVYEDDTYIAFLNKYPTLYAYTLVAPKEHRQNVTADYSLEEYLNFQKLLYRIAEAIRRVVPTERMYILSLGSQQANSHVHWHIAPLPPGVPLEKQQYFALMMENGVLSMPEKELAELARRIGENLQVLTEAVI